MLVALALLLALNPPPAPSGSSAAEPAVADDYGSLPLSFAPAQGWEGADYISSTSAGTVALGEHGATVVPAGRGAEPIVMSLAGGQRSLPLAQAKLPGVVNDLRGDDPSRWRTNVPTYARVRYPDVYPGIAMDYHGATGTLEYDFRVAPGADPGRIAVDFHGADLRIAGSGALVVGSGPAAIRQAPPVAYQPAADGREPVPAAFTVRGDRAGFELGTYDPSRPLVIDPLVLSYSTFLGGSPNAGNGGDDRIEDVAVDSSGNAYLTGATSSLDFPTTSGAFDQTISNEQTYGTDVFVSKLNPDGTGLVYSTFLGGFYSESGYGIAVDSSGNAYVTGYTDSTRPCCATFPTTAGAYTTPGNADDGRGDVFVTKLNPSGSALVYSSVFGGHNDDKAYGIALDGANPPNAYVAGGTGSAPISGAVFPTTAGAYQQGSAYGGNSNDAFVTKLNGTGTAPVFSTLLGATGSEVAQGIDVDSTGRPYVTGYTTAFGGNDFPTTAANRFAAADVNSADAFLTRLSADGASLQYSTAIGTDGNGSNDGSDYSNAVAVGADGIAFITGSSSTGAGTDYPLKNQYEGRNGQCCFGLDLFVAKFDTNASGNASLLYSTLIGGSGTESGTAIAVGTDGNAVIGGETGNATGEKYDFVAGELGGGTGRGTAFVTKIVQSGSTNATLAYSTSIPNGGFAGDFVSGLALDADGNVYAAGSSTGNAPIGTTAGAYQPSHSGEDDGFAVKISFSNDTDPPETQITGGPCAGCTVTSNPFTFTFSADEVSTFECSYDGGAYTACSSPGPGLTGSDTRSLGNGNHAISVRARDAASNVDATPVTRQFGVFIDSSPPDTSITSGPAAGSTVTSSSVTFGLSSTESNSTFECSYDGAPYTACTTPGPGTSGSDTRTLGNGSHTFAARARDGAGNVDGSAITRTFTVNVSSPPPPDTAPPETTITNAPPAKIKSKKLPVSVTLEFAASEPGSTFACKVDDGPLQGCSSPATLKLAKGKHTISVVATDGSGNADASPATVQVEVKKKKRKKKKGGGGKG